MSDHIGSFLQLHHRITESGQKLEDIHIVHAILLLLPRSGIWDVVKQNSWIKAADLPLMLLLLNCCQYLTALNENANSMNLRRNKKLTSWPCLPSRLQVQTILENLEMSIRESSGQNGNLLVPVIPVVKRDIGVPNVRRRGRIKNEPNLVVLPI